MAPLWATPPGFFVAPELGFPELRAVLDAGGPLLPPYQGLADVWGEHAVHQLPDYPAFLTALTRAHRLTIGSVLDLACGTGTLATRLAGVAAEVVGLDKSEPMLAAARRQAARPGVSFVPGDMRDFDLDRLFDAVVCASNSLNYVAGRDELCQVLARVVRHLRPGGMFVFDTTTTHGMRLLVGPWYHFGPGGRRLAMRFKYDPSGRRQTAQVVTAAGLETHRRVAIDKSDVRTAVVGTGLAVVEQFSAPFLFGDWEAGPSTFHVLKRTG